MHVCALACHEAFGIGFFYVCVYVCVCVCTRERSRMRGCMRVWAGVCMWLLWYSSICVDKCLLAHS